MRNKSKYHTLMIERKISNFQAHTDLFSYSLFQFTLKIYYVKMNVQKIDSKREKDYILFGETTKYDGWASFIGCSSFNLFFYLL